MSSPRLRFRGHTHSEALQFPSSPGAWALQPKINFCLWQFFCGTKSHHAQPLDRSSLKSRSRHIQRVSRRCEYLCVAETIPRHLAVVWAAAAPCGARSPVQRLSHPWLLILSYLCERVRRFAFSPPRAHTSRPAYLGAGATSARYCKVLCVAETI